MNSKHLDKSQFASKLIQFSTVSNVFTLQVVNVVNIVYYGKTRMHVLRKFFLIKKFSPFHETRDHL